MNESFWRHDITMAREEVRRLGLLENSREEVRSLGLLGGNSESDSKNGKLSEPSNLGEAIPDFLTSDTLRWVVKRVVRGGFNLIQSLKGIVKILVVTSKKFQKLPISNLNTVTTKFNVSDSENLSNSNTRSIESSVDNFFDTYLASRLARARLVLRTQGFAILPFQFFFVRIGITLDSLAEETRLSEFLTVACHFLYLGVWLKPAFDWYVGDSTATSNWTQSLCGVLYCFWLYWLAGLGMGVLALQLAVNHTEHVGFEKHSEQKRVRRGREKKSRIEEYTAGGYNNVTTNTNSNCKLTKEKDSDLAESKNIDSDELAEDSVTTGTNFKFNPKNCNMTKSNSFYKIYYQRPSEALSAGPPSNLLSKSVLPRSYFRTTSISKSKSRAESGCEYGDTFTGRPYELGADNFRAVNLSNDNRLNEVTTLSTTVPKCSRYTKKEVSFLLEPKSWVEKQIEMSGNISVHPRWDWYWGGLNLHIEHHLFPRMPREHYRKVAGRVRRELCEKHRISYKEKDFFEAIGGFVRKIFVVGEVVGKEIKKEE